MGFRTHWCARMAIVSIGNLAAAFLTDGSLRLVHVGVALGLAALAVYAWHRPHRRVGQARKKPGPDKDHRPAAFIRFR